MHLFLLSSGSGVVLIDMDTGVTFYCYYDSIKSVSIIRL